MTTLNISIPESLKEFLEREAMRAGFSSSSEYIELLIREDLERKAHAELERQVIAGLNSGPSTEMTADDWNKIRGEVKRRAAERSITER